MTTFLPAAALDFHEPPPVLKLENAGTFFPTTTLPVPPLALTIFAGELALAGALAADGLPEADAFFPGIFLGLHGFENGVEVELVAQIHEFLAQRRDVNLARDVHHHLY